MKKPLDHLPPAEERDEANPPQPSYPGTGDAGTQAGVSPDTAAEPEEPKRHGLDKPPRSGA